jgi:hypothetical protein
MRLARRESEAGFALLLVLAMASTVAIMMLLAVPRIEFEAQRDKEQLLIDRGEQYTRAVQLYVRKFNRYPADFDALEKTANLRFLRHRYQDPFTGKDDWRIIHVGPGGIFTDSLLYNKKKDDKSTEKQTFIAELPTTVSTDPSQQVNIAGRRRDSDQPNAPGSGTPDPNNPNQFQNQNPGQLPNPGQIQNPNAQYEPPPPGVQLPPGVQMPAGVQVPPGVYGLQGTQNQPSQSAASLINNLLTTPRPGGLAGLQQPPPGVDQYGNAMPQQPANTLPGVPIQTTTPGTPVQAQTQQQTIGGGIAGVASKQEQDGIKVYRDQKAYDHWEFVYDLSQDKTRNGNTSNVPQTATPGQGQTAAPGTAPATPLTPVPGK